ncbi:MAG: hypothetical protein IPI46_12840 [Bacteroidetes bacterium]|nr:hypothetical protein [Bacteroidota bacterium]
MKLLVSILFMVISLQLFAIKKGKHFTYVSGTCIHAVDSIKKVGDIYDFTIKTHKTKLLIDSVWFGATPVPCDVYESTTNHKVAFAFKKGKYHVRVNKNLYQNFPTLVDSTQAHKNFKASVPFKGDAMIMYIYKGKRYFESVSGVEIIKKKGTR